MTAGSNSPFGNDNRTGNLERWKTYLADSWGHLSPQWTTTTASQASVLLRLAEDACNELIEPRSAAAILRSYLNRILEDIRFSRRNRLAHSEIWEVFGVSYPEWQVTGPEEPTSDPSRTYLEYLLKRYGAGCPELLRALAIQDLDRRKMPSEAPKRLRRRVSLGPTAGPTLEAYDENR